GGPNAGQAGPCTPTPTKVALANGVTAAQLAVGSNAACIRTPQNDIYCWGNNGDGAVRAPPSASLFFPTKNANVNQDAADVSVSSSAEGFTTVCIARVGTGRVDCWGQSLSSLFVTSGVSGCVFGSGPCDPASHPVPTSFQTNTGNVFADRVQVGYLTACAVR